QSFEKVLAADFQGSSLRPVESRVVRPGPALEIRRVTFAPQASLGPAAFLQELRSTLGSYAKILTAEFQVTQIDAAPGRSKTRVRYELVGGGPDFHREQRVGEWELEWKAGALGRWRASGGTRSRSAAPWFADLTAQAFGGNRSYSQQLLRGVDYWRTVLDGACGIDIYGHNGVSPDYARVGAELPGTTDKSSCLLRRDRPTAYARPLCLWMLRLPGVFMTASGVFRTLSTCMRTLPLSVLQS